MSGRDALLALAARCEAAEGPSRELDEAIVQGVYPELDIRRDGPDGLWRAHGSTMGRACLLRVEDYTASLDAALTLVPKGWRWSLDYTQRAPYQDCGCAALFAPGDGIKPPDVPETYARTPALALCAAALRALAEGRE